MWEIFFNSLFPQRNGSENMIRKGDTIFQIMFNLLHSCRKKISFRISIPSGIHDKCRLKQLIQILNTMGLCISYHELERIDCSLANEIIDSCVESKVSVPRTLTSSSIIHGAMNILIITKILLRTKAQATILCLWYFIIRKIQQKLTIFH